MFLLRPYPFSLRSADSDPPLCPPAGWAGRVLPVSPAAFSSCALHRRCSQAHRILERRQCPLQVAPLVRCQEPSHFSLGIEPRRGIPVLQRLLFLVPLIGRELNGLCPPESRLPDRGLVGGARPRD